MPASGYSALPHSRRASISARAAEEMDMAFESDDEEQQNDTTPLANQYTPSRANVEDASSANSAMTYDFERDYDYPPPGSPPRTSMSELGNSNGIIPSFSTPPRRDPPSQPARPSFFRRAVGALLPQHYARVPTSDSSDTGHEARGSGVENDGVFSNVIAKSSNTAPRRPVGAGNDAGNDDVYVMPEEIQKEAPPSYDVAEADAVPPYWETTIHAPSYGSSDDPMIEGLPAGTVFSFAWNLLISISFQFIGFMLTYLLHTSHAAKFGSRAGLGVTLIQYGLYSRNAQMDVGFGDESDSEVATTEFGDRSVGIVRRGYKVLSRRAWDAIVSASDSSSDDPAQTKSMMSPHDWLSFLLMTIGWFLLLSSVLGFARVKRWEWSIRDSTPSSSQSDQPQQQQQSMRILTPDHISRDAQVRSQLQAVFGLELSDDRDEESRPLRSHVAHGSDGNDTTAQAAQIEQALANQASLRDNLRAAWLI